MSLFSRWHTKRHFVFQVRSLNYAFADLFQAASTLRKALHEPMNEARLCTPCSELQHNSSQGTFQASGSKVFLSHQWSSTKGATWVLTLCRQRVQETQASHKPKWKRGWHPSANCGMLHQLIKRFKKSKHSLNGRWKVLSDAGVHGSEMQRRN